jgi:ferredoxin, 2Fe-2S
MPKVTFQFKDGSEKTVDGDSGYSVMETAVKHGITQIEGACGGSLACATCHVYVPPTWWDKVLPADNISENEQDMLEIAFDARPHSRLSCQIILRDDLDGLTLALPGRKTDW